MPFGTSAMEVWEQFWKVGRNLIKMGWREAEGWEGNNLKYKHISTSMTGGLSVLK